MLVVGICDTNSELRIKNKNMVEKWISIFLFYYLFYGALTTLVIGQKYEILQSFQTSLADLVMHSRQAMLPLTQGTL